MPVAAGVVGDGRVRAGVVLAARDMAAERRRAAALDCAHHLQLVEADVSAVGLTPSGTMVAEDIRDLHSQAGPWSRKISATSTVGRPMSAALTPPVWAYALFLGRWCVPPSCASGLSMAAIRPVATRV